MEPHVGCRSESHNQKLPVTNRQFPKNPSSRTKNLQKNAKTLRVELTGFPPLCHTHRVMAATTCFSRRPPARNLIRVQRAAAHEPKRRALLGHGVHLNARGVPEISRGQATAGSVAPGIRALNSPPLKGGRNPRRISGSMARFAFRARLSPASATNQQFFIPNHT
jgi:hypothetical protein